MTTHSRQRRTDVAIRIRRTLLAAFIAVAAFDASIAAPPPRGTAAKPPAGVVTIWLQPMAATTHGEVVIGDVASVEGGDAALRTRIAGLDLADAPELGKTTRLTRELIAHRIRIAGFDAQRYKILGAESVTLSPRGCRVSEQEIITAAKQFLLTRLPWNAEDITIEPNRPVKGPVQVSGAREDIRLEASLHSPRLALGTARVDVAIHSKGVKQAEVAVSFDVHHHRNIAVATRRINRDQVLTHEDIVYERRVVDAVSGYLTESESPVGQRAKRVIPPLQAVTKADVDSGEPDAAVVIRQRDPVRLVVRAGNLVVTASGEALQDGRTGQMIRVRNADSKAVVTGRVVNRSEVQVVY